MFFCYIKAMKKFFLLCVLCWFVGILPLFCQEEEGSPEGTPEGQEEMPEDTPEGIEGTDPEYVVRMNQKGDQYIMFMLGLAIPVHPTPDKLIVGGEGILGYMHFLTSTLAVGGTLDFGYHATVGKNVFYYVPISVRVTYQPTFRRFEFPLSLSIGGAFENYLERTYFGFFVKPEAAVYFRLNAAWSFGGGVGLMIMPQWYKETANNYVGIVTDVILSARYHF
jgi:hypothetical protein